MRQRILGVSLVVALVLWLIVFIAGVTQDSSAALHSLYRSFFSTSLVVFIIAWAWTNILFLSCIASVVGELGRTLGDDASVVRVGFAIARGFFVYLVLISGQLVLAGSLTGSEGGVPTFSVNQGLYFRAGILASLVSFAAGYNPGLFLAIIKKVEERIVKKMEDT